MYLVHFLFVLFFLTAAHSPVSRVVASLARRISQQGEPRRLDAGRVWNELRVVWELSKQWVLE